MQCMSYIKNRSKYFPICIYTHITSRLLRFPRCGGSGPVSRLLYKYLQQRYKKVEEPRNKTIYTKTQIELRTKIQSIQKQKAKI
jgi:hypothetical protein